MELIKDWLPWILALGGAIGWIWERISSRKHAAILLEQANVKLLQDIIKSLREENSILKTDKEAKDQLNLSLSEINKGHAEEIRKMRNEIQELKNALIKAKVIPG